MSKPLLNALAGLAAVVLIAMATAPSKPAPASLWQVYEQSLKEARYVDLTHTINPSIPVWAGFGRSTFGPALDPKTGKPFTYEKDGFAATRYDLGTETSANGGDLALADAMAKAARDTLNGIIAQIAPGANPAFLVGKAAAYPATH